LYKELLFTEDAEKVEPIVRQLEKLFLKRKKNPYYSGGELTEGGGPSNDVTVDYRLGAILKFKSFKGSLYIVEMGLIHADSCWTSLG